MTTGAKLHLPTSHHVLLHHHLLHHLLHILLSSRTIANSGLSNQILAGLTTRVAFLLSHTQYGQAKENAQIR